MIDFLCPCCSGVSYIKCCGVYIIGDKLPKTPEQLMRSRFTAYSIGDMGYISKTMSGKALYGFNPNELVIQNKDLQWTKLEIIKSKLKSNTIGLVEFKAYYNQSNINYVQHEISTFNYIKARWFYVDGIILYNGLA